MSRDIRLRHVLLILAVAVPSLFIGLGSTSLWEPDEPRFAEATRQMLIRGDYLTPYFNGQPRFEKPILFYWMEVVSYRLLGITETAARLPAALAGLGTVLLVYAMGARLFTRRAGLVGSLVLATTFRFVVFSRQALTDLPVIFFIVAALYAFERALDTPAASVRLALAGWGGVGLAALTKGPLAFLPVMIWITYLVTTRQTGGWGRWHAARGVPLALGVGLPWYVYMIRVHGHAYTDFAFGHEIAARVASAQFPGPSRGFFYYLGVFPGDAAPWSLYFLAAIGWLAITWRSRDPSERRGVALCLAWFFVVFLVFSASRSKVPHYVLPAYPAAALLVGLLIDRADAKPHEVPRRIWAAATWLTGALALIVAVLSGLFLRRVFHTPYASGDMLFPLILGAGAVGMMIFQWQGRRAAAVGALLAALAGSYGSLAAYTLPRDLEQLKAVRGIGERIRSMAHRSDGVSLTGRLGGSGLIFYARHDIDWLDSPDAVVRYLAAPGRRFSVLPEPEFRAVRSAYRGELFVLDRRRMLNVRLSKLFAEHPSDDRTFVLVSNKAPEQAPALQPSGTVPRR